MSSDKKLLEMLKKREEEQNKDADKSLLDRLREREAAMPTAPEDDSDPSQRLAYMIQQREWLERYQTASDRVENHSSWAYLRNRNKAWNFRKTLSDPDIGTGGSDQAPAQEDYDYSELISQENRDRVRQEIQESRRVEPGTVYAAGGNNTATGGTQYGARLQDPALSPDIAIDARQEQGLINYVDKYSGRSYKDNFFGQFAANYDYGRISQDAAMAWSDYLNKPTEANRQAAEVKSQILKEFQERNEAALDDENVQAGWISKSLAGYLPQFLDQTATSGSMALVGLLGGPTFSKAAASTGSFAYSYQTVQGAAFKSLLDAGVPEEKARAMAQDEAVISALIEMGDTALDLATLGGGKLLDLVGKGSVKTIRELLAKKAGKGAWQKLASVLGKYGMNIAGEFGEEALQEAVSITNQQEGGQGAWQLAGNTLGTLGRAVTGKDPEAREQIWEAGLEGGKLAMMMGGAQMGTNALISRGVQSAQAKPYRGSVQELVDEALEMDPENATALKMKRMLENDEKPSSAQILELVAQNEELIHQAEDRREVPAREDAQSQQEAVEGPAAEPEGRDMAMEPEAQDDQGGRTIEEVAAQYPGQEETVQAVYRLGAGKQDVEKFQQAFKIAYDMGKSGVKEHYVLSSEALDLLTDEQKRHAFQAGAYAADTKAKTLSAGYTTGKGWRKGTVTGEGVTIQDLTETFNDPQKRAYKVLSTFAEATGIDIVLYKSSPDDKGRFQGDQGKFQWSTDKIYIDIHAGLSKIKDVDQLAKYTMLRTLGHETTHFIEKWNAVEYNELRKTVFDAMEAQGEDPVELIERYLARDTSGKMTYDDASREVVAEGLSDIFRDSELLQKLADRNKSLFEKLMEKVKDFLRMVKEAFADMIANGSRESRALQKQMADGVRYLEEVVAKFDQTAAKAVEHYQASKGQEVREKVVEEAKEAPTAQEKGHQEHKHGPKAVEDEQKEQGQKEQEEPKEEVPEYRDSRGFTIRKNEARGTLEVGFDSKPPEAVRDALKAMRYRWSSKEKVWYGKADRDTTIQALEDAYDGLDTKPKEVYDDADNAERVLRSAGDGPGDLRLLEDQQAGAAKGDGTERSAVELPGKRGVEAERHGDGADVAGPVGGHGQGTGQGGDLRPDDLKTDDPPAAETEPETPAQESLDPTTSPEQAPLHKEVRELIQQRSTDAPKGTNFIIGESLDLPRGEKSRYKANIEAIRLVKRLEAEGRYATQEEQQALSRYVGWGGLDNVFDERKAEWEKEYRELKELLTEEEYNAAKGSTLNAHYTELSVIRAMYDGLQGLGFTGGRVLEPSAGTGLFAGAMPQDLRSGVRSMTMVELDSITGRIAKYLYPNLDVRIQGFENANIPDNYMDVAVGNVPFGNYPIYDRKYPKKVTSSIHNYFFAKALDKVRPGGIVMFITSSYTMDSRESQVRNYIKSKADLLGAIRLPNTAFKQNAGTDVVTDILVLKKRPPGKPYGGVEFAGASYQWFSKFGAGGYINDYFAAHPEMMLGAPASGGMYRSGGLTFTPLEGQGSLADQIRSAFSKIDGKMDYPVVQSPDKVSQAVEKAVSGVKNNSLVVREGKVYRYVNGTLFQIKASQDDAQRIEGMLNIRSLARELLFAQQQGKSTEQIQDLRMRLNQGYDSFVKKYGPLNDRTNLRSIGDDPDGFFLQSLEHYDAKSKKATKADIFTKDTVATTKMITSTATVSEGLIVSVNQTGGVDVGLIARLTGRREEDVSRELLDSRAVFKDRDGELETAERYLSGNVRAKLRDAQALAAMDPEYEKNVEALKQVIPRDIPYQDIYVTPGTPWIPNAVYSDFAAAMLGSVNREYHMAVEVVRNASTGNFTVELRDQWLKHSAANTQKWGTPKRSFLELLEAVLNSRSVVVRQKDAEGNSIIDKDATAAANEKVEQIQQEFQKWLWQDEGRQKELAYLYNETFNAIVTPKYNGEHLTVDGHNAQKPLRPHQRNAVQRIIASGGNTLLAHRVGAGKTYEMAAAAMKLRQLGLVRKPMFIVPKSLVAQWGKEFMDFFPTAKVLVAESGDFTPANRKLFANRIANGEYDAVIVSYEQFEKLPMSDDFTREMYQEQIDSVIAALEEARAEKSGKSMSVKDLEKKRKSLQAKIDRLADTPKDQDNILFEELGVDGLFVDEAHNFKNLFYTTSMNNVAGLGNKDGSKRAFDLYTKVRYLQKLNGGRGVVFATATPVMNSMSEMYIMQRYLQPDVLEQLGLTTFDAWAKQFGEVVNSAEIKPSGQGYRVKQSFSRFKNLGELQLLFRNFADVLTDIPGLKVPKMKGGAVNVVVCQPGQFQRDYMQELEDRAENIKNVDPSQDNMLKITSDGRKVSYTQRMIDPSLPYEEGCKIYRCADNVLRTYRESSDIKGTQLIFCDMATPKGKSKNETSVAEEGMDLESVRLYDDLKARLVKGGIPAGEIAFIHTADTDAKKKKLFEDVNNGTVRVLIGSTGKMGVGMNAQKRVVAIHHLDAPWRPGDVEQRNGRAYRQGNINEEVECFTYVTEGSFDARLWDILERKQNFIDQIMNGDDVGREAEDTGDVTLSAAEVKALASGSPLIMEQVQLDTEIKKLESLRRSHTQAVQIARVRQQEDIKRIATLERLLENGREDLKQRQDTYSEGKFSITIGRSTYTDKKDAGAALMTAIVTKATEEYTTIGHFAGFAVQVQKTDEGFQGVLAGKQRYSFKVYPEKQTFMITQLCKVPEGIEAQLKDWENKLETLKKDVEEQKVILATPFSRQEELTRKRARYQEVMNILNPKEEQRLDDDGQEQSQGRRDVMSDRDVLEEAAQMVKPEDLSPGERDALDIFQDRLEELRGLQQQREEQGQEYRKHRFEKPVDRAAAQKTLERMKLLDDKIRTAQDRLLAVEETSVLRQVLQKAREVVENEQKEKDEQILKRWRDRRNNADTIRKYRAAISRDVKDMTDWVLRPGNKDVLRHMPEVLKSTVIPFLTQIDFNSKRSLKGGEATKADQVFFNRLNGLKDALDHVRNDRPEELYSGFMDLPPRFMEDLQSFVAAVNQVTKENKGTFQVNLMTAEELKKLAKIVKNLKVLVKNFNSFHANAMYHHVHQAGDSTISALSEMKAAKSRSEAGEWLDNWVNWQQIRPAYGFSRFGEGGKAIYDGLRRGQAQLAFDAKEIIDFVGETYTPEEVRSWERKVNTFKVGDTSVSMTVAQVMSLYELSKRKQALGHILGDGFRPSVTRAGKEKISGEGVRVTPEELDKILSSLTPRQREIADKLQRFMQERGGSWGNRVSMQRFGEKLFGEENYFPINSDGQHLEADTGEAPDAASLYALLNMGFTKQTKPDAKNRLVVYSIFNVFANHMGSMAQYHAMALPVLDALKWFNYKSRDEAGLVTDGVREEMSRVFGVPEEKKAGRGNPGYAVQFVTGILKAYNGTECQGIPSDSFGINALHKYNLAQVAFNIRVVVQQPMAVTRAVMILDPGSFTRGSKLSPKAISANIQEMEAHSGIAVWKGLGFYDTNISRGLTALIRRDQTSMDKVMEFGMKGAEKADKATWAWIWSACKEEVKKKPSLVKEGQTYLEAVSDLFEEVIYKTQVVDSVMTKNAFMRSKGALARATGSFMSEPTTTFSMVSDAWFRFRTDLDQGMTYKDAWKKHGKFITRLVGVYALGALVTAAAQAAADAWRDDDDYQTGWEKFLEAFTGNLADELMPLNKLPIARDAYELLKELLRAAGFDTYGNQPRSIYMQWGDSLVNGFTILNDHLRGEETNYTWYSGIYKLLQAVSGMTGVPVATPTREIVSLWNNLVGAMAPSLKIKTYDPGPLSSIKYALLDGYLTEEEAREELLRLGLVEGEDQAYWTVKEWLGGEDYSRYKGVMDAAMQGKDLGPAMEELLEHGYKEREIYSQVKSQIRKWYEDGQISKEKAQKLLYTYQAELDMSAEDISAALNMWSCKVVTGVAFQDIKELYLEGSLSAAKVIEMYQRYGGYTREDARNKIRYWDYQKKYPDTTVYQGWFDTYAEKVEASGVPLEIYISYRSATREISGKDEKERKVEAIHALKLTDKQKDALYLAEGYAESGLKDTPWH